MKKRDKVGAGWFEANHRGDSCESRISVDSNATPCLRAIKLAMFARDQMQLNMACDYAGDVFDQMKLHACA